ncbi:MAG: hypothetical protein JW922_09335 [Paludibacteraceae bacterium]|nr:hypothetical protein [Paludibacteraceae bacterium]
MTKQFFDDNPLFIPKVADLTAIDAGADVPAVIMDLHHTKWRQHVPEKIIEAGIPLIVDPVTGHLLFDGAKNKANFKKLNYAKDISPEALYSDAEARLKKVIEPAIADQLSAGASVIVVPAFYSADISDIKFNLNLNLLSETLRYLEGKNIKLPVFVSINLGYEVLARPTECKYVVDMYCGDYKDKVSGYFVTINGLDARKADVGHLLGLADLVFQLAKGKTVITKHVGGFGEVLSAVGCSGFSSGLAEGETFSTKNLEVRKKGFGRPGGWTYVPEIFDYANDVELKKIGYTCSCKYCNGGVPEDAKSKKLHYLEQRLRIIDALKSLDRAGRIRLMKTKLQEAINFVGQHIGSPFKTDHLYRWVEILNKAEGWEHMSEDDEAKLNELLNEIDNGQ